jgi:protein-S-isoprenylcysteine O-methyltransferase Ste14
MMYDVLYIMLRYVVLCYAVLIYVTLCYVQRSVEARAAVTWFPYLYEEYQTQVKMLLLFIYT